MRYKKFTVEEIFPRLETGMANNGMLEDGEDCFYLGAKKNDNGVMRMCAYDHGLVQEGNCIVFICNGQGSVGYSLYMDRPFIASSDLVMGYNRNLNKYNAMFLVTIIDRERPRYSYGRKWKNTLKATKLLLPCDEQGKVDWYAMERYIKERIIPILPSRAKDVWKDNFNPHAISTTKINMEATRWKIKRFEELIDTENDIYKARCNNAISLTPCSPNDNQAILYVTRTDTNNGCKCYVKDDGLTGIEEGNAITIGDTTATPYYQKDKFVCGDHIVVIRPSWLNVFTGLFIVTLLGKEKFRYNYGRAFTMDLILSTELILPVLDNDEPNWVWIENYMKGLPFSANI